MSLANGANEISTRGYKRQVCVREEEDDFFVYTAVFPPGVGTIFNDDLAYIFLPMIVNDYPSGPDLIVETLDVSGGEIDVTIKNDGDTAVSNPFWVDVYIKPSTAPTAVNQTISLERTS